MITAWDTSIMPLDDTSSDDVQVIHLHFHRGADEGRVTALEEQIVTVESDLTALTAQVTEFNEDIAAKVAALETAQGNFTPAGRVAFDALKATVEAGVTAVGDADEDGNPIPPVPPEPLP